MIWIWYKNSKILTLKNWEKKVHFSYENRWIFMMEIWETNFDKIRWFIKIWYKIDTIIWKFHYLSWQKLWEKLLIYLLKLREILICKNGEFLGFLKWWTLNEKVGNLQVRYLWARKNILCLRLRQAPPATSEPLAGEVPGLLRLSGKERVCDYWILIW